METRSHHGKGRRSAIGLIALLVLIVLFFVVWLILWRSSSTKDIVDARTVPVITVASSSFTDGGMIPSKFTCDGGDISPQLTASGFPANTKSLAWVVDDPDAPIGTFTHWVIFNLPTELSSLPEGASARPENLLHAIQGKNDFDKIGYGGPCPPGEKPHHYVFHAYAVDSLLELSEGATKSEVASALKGHILAEGKLVGLYVRGR